MEEPVAMGRERLSNRVGAFYESCGAIQAKLQLQPNSAQDVYILLGCDKSYRSCINVSPKI
ncbi:hypothetical protein KHA80_00540 [Anaerobacillus sp. HL2]|nr:hypothetical protein KHA80_00540 [Anaerobacillus sp. HL2]